MNRARVRQWLRDAVGIQAQAAAMLAASGMPQAGLRKAVEAIESPVFVLTPDVVELLAAGYQGWDEDERLLTEDTRAYPDGFAYLTIPVSDDYAGRIHKAIAWRSYENHVLIVDWGGYPDEAPRCWVRPLMFGLSPMEQVREEAELALAVNGGLVTVADSDGRTIETRRVTSAELITGRTSASYHRLPLVLWRFLQQQIVVAARPPSALPSNVAARLGPERIETLRIVTLRRAMQRRSDETGHEERNYSHRWVVRGHWVNQWYPTLQDHRQLWRAEHVAGPPDKPLVVKEMLYLVRR